MSRELRYRYHVYLSASVVTRLEEAAAGRRCDPQELAGELLAQALRDEGLAVSALPPAVALRGPSFVGPFPAEGEGWCRSGIPEDWKAPSSPPLQRRGR